MKSPSKGQPRQEPAAQGLSAGSQRKAHLILSKVDENPSTSFLRGYRQFWRFLRPYALLALLGLLLTIPVGALDAVMTGFLKPFMDKVMVGQDKEFASMVPFYIIAFTVVQGLLLYFSALVNGYVGGKIALDIKASLYKKLLSMDTAFYDSNSSGSVIYRFSSDADAASSGLITNIRLFLTKFFSSLSLVCVLLYNSWQLSVLAIGVLVCLVLPMSVVRKRIKKIISKSMKQNTRVMTIYNETTEGNRVIKSFCLKELMYSRFMEVMGYLFSMNIKLVRDTNWLAPAMHLITAAGVAGVLYFGMHLILTGVITSGAFVAFLAALIMLYTPIKSIGNNFINVQQALLALDRIYQILDVHSYEEDKEGKALSGIGEVKFDDVRFGYTDDREILKGVSFNVRRGTKVALVGNSGGGKTTACALIPRLYDPDSGRITIDGTDIRDFALDSLRSKIAVVFQDNFLFEGSIRENLRCAREGVTEDEMRKAVSEACLDEFIASLPEGLDTQIGERGLRLSGGQKQRLAIARAILKDAPLVILDEATSALDNKSEKVVQEALDTLMRGRTTIVIAHRLSTIMDSDEILVLNDGVVAERGTHAQLLAKGGIYSGLYRSQFQNTRASATGEPEAQG